MFLTRIQSQQIVFVVRIDFWMQLDVLFLHIYADFCIVYSIVMFIISHRFFASGTLHNVLKSIQLIILIVTDDLWPQNKNETFFLIGWRGSWLVVFVMPILKLLATSVAKVLKRIIRIKNDWSLHVRSLSARDSSCTGRPWLSHPISIVSDVRYPQYPIPEESNIRYPYFTLMQVDS